ncbi:hypothetical protein HELRODRAFT_163376 [Helobdella robusta]|uniref:DNA mismatch repair proteins mutS family domain-containing protein n=1 Tax=Helobdella robusta TaxID=6412 RepID=T1ETZ2_HELRO|nr:hypothetical protein HELRODRAFT_163376 [Helobdella robusta]ESN96325.1 hypothetical protein HELRODRAFT_163376 [Helobdella robusta]
MRSLGGLLRYLEKNRIGVLNKCKSAVGSRMLREWFKHPLSDINTIKMRHKAVEYFCRPSSFEIVQAMQNSIKNMKNIAPIMKRMLQAQCNHSDWKTLHKTIIACVSSYDILSHSDFFDVQILAQVDFEETDINQRFTMKFGIDEELDEKKRIYGSLSVLMLDVCRQECQTLPSFIQGCNVVYFPQIGFLTSIEETENMKATKDYTIPSKEYLVCTSHLYFTCILISFDFLYQKLILRLFIWTNLDRKYGDLKCIINDMEMRHMHNLQNKILESSSLLMNIISCFAEIDCLLSFAYSARVNNYVKPVMVKDNIISIKNGRHPLLELRDTFVPNDVTSGSPHKILIITAANASGKSVYLKQVGLIIFMAQIGSFVPAESATLGIITEIFTRLCTVESIAIPMSSFLIDLNNVALALKSSTPRSLILLDEFGQGTQEADGAALLAATIKSLDDRGDNCPHLIVSTHFHILTHSKVIEPSNRIKFMTLAIMVDENDHNSPLTYLHELKDGYADCSYALNLAKMVGLPQMMIDRALQIWEYKKQGLPIMPDVPESDKQKYVQIFDKFLELNVQDDEEIMSFIEFVKSLTFEIDM